MNTKLNTILRASTSVQAALLRFHNEKGQQTLQVKVAFPTGNSLYCLAPDEIPGEIKVADTPVHLVQKYKDDYFFISGYISGEKADNPRILSIVITKATWFVRKSRGSVSWLREKHTYESEQVMRHAS